MVELFDGVGLSDSFGMISSVAVGSVGRIEQIYSELGYSKVLGVSCLKSLGTFTGCWWIHCLLEDKLLQSMSTVFPVADTCIINESLWHVFLG